MGRLEGILGRLEEAYRNGKQKSGQGLSRMRQDKARLSKIKPKGAMDDAVSRAGRCGRGGSGSDT